MVRIEGAKPNGRSMEGIHAGELLGGMAVVLGGAAGILPMEYGYNSCGNIEPDSQYPGKSTVSMHTTSYKFKIMGSARKDSER